MEEALDKLNSLLISGTVPTHKIMKTFEEMFGYPVPLDEGGFRRVEDALRSRTDLFEQRGSNWHGIPTNSTARLAKEIKLSQQGGREGGRSSSGNGGRNAGGGGGRGNRGGGGGYRGGGRGGGASFHGASFARALQATPNISQTFPKNSTYRGGDNADNISNDWNISQRPLASFSNDYNYSSTKNDPYDNHYRNHDHNEYNSRIYSRANDRQDYSRNPENREDDYRRQSNYADDQYNSQYHDDRRSYRDDDRNYGNQNDNHRDYERRDFDEAQDYAGHRDYNRHRDYDDYQSRDTTYYNEASSSKDYRDDRSQNNWESDDRREYYNDYVSQNHQQQPAVPPPGLVPVRPPPGFEPNGQERRQYEQSRASSETTLQAQSITPSMVINLMVDLFKGRSNKMSFAELNRLFKQKNNSYAKSIAGFKEGAHTPELFVKKFIHKAEGKLRIEGDFLYLLEPEPEPERVIRPNYREDWWNFYVQLHEYLGTGPMLMASLLANLSNDSDQQHKFKVALIKVYMRPELLSKGLCRSFYFNASIFGISTSKSNEKKPSEIQALGEAPNNDIYEETVALMPELLPEDRPALQFLRSADRTPVDPAPSVKSGTPSYYSATTSPTIEQMQNYEIPALQQNDDLPPIISKRMHHELVPGDDEAKFNQYEGKKIRIMTPLTSLGEFWVIFEDDEDTYATMQEDVKAAWKNPVPSLYSQWQENDAAIYRANDCYYRANLLNTPKREGGKSSQVEIELVDAGGRELVSLRDITPLPRDLSIQPAIALRCGVLPFSITDQDRYHSIMKEVEEEIRALPHYSLTLSKIQMFTKDDRFIVDISIDNNEDLRKKFFMNKAIQRLNISLPL